MLQLLIDGRLIAQAMHYSGGVNLQLFEYDHNGNRRRGVSVNAPKDEAREFFEGAMRLADEAGKVGT